MSLGYLYTSKTSIQNIGVESIANISTPNGDILLGTNAGSLDPGTGLIAIGTNAGQVSIGPANTFIGLNAAPSNINGGSNIFIGPSVALNNTSGNENIFLGVLAGKQSKVGNRNIYLGHLAAELNVDGNYNLVIGNFNSSTQFSNYTHGSTYNFNNALNIGNLGLVYGDNGLGIGNGNVTAKNSIVLGNQAAGTSNHSLTIGNNVVNNGTNNVVIITDSNLYDSNGKYITSSNDVVIINNLTFNGSMMTAPGVSFGISNGGVVMSNAQGYINLGNDGIKEYTICNYEVSRDNATFMMDSNGVLIDTTNFDLYSFSNSLIMNSNLIDLYGAGAINIHNDQYSLDLDSNAIVLGNLGQSNLVISSNVFNVSILTTNIDSNLNVYGITNLSNNVYIGGDFTAQNNSVFNGGVNFNSSNIDFLYGLALDKLVVNNVDMFSAFTSLSNYITEIVSGVNTANSGAFISGISCPYESDKNKINFQGSVSVKSNLYIGGSLYAEKICFSQISINGPMTFSNAVAFNGNVFMNSNLYVDGIGSFNSNLSVNGNTSLNNNLNVIGHTNIGMDLSVEGKLLVKNIDILSLLLSGHGGCNFVFAENDTFSNNVFMNSNLNIQGNLLVDNVNILSKLSSLSNYAYSISNSGYVNVPGLITSDYNGSCPAFTDSNNINYNEGSLVIQDNLHVGGVLCADTISFTNMNISGPLVFSGPVTFESNIDIKQFSLNGLVNSNNTSNLQILLDQFVLNGGNMASAWITSNSNNGSGSNCPAFTDCNNININEGSMIIQDHLHVGGTLCADTMQFNNIQVTGVVQANSDFVFDGKAIFNGPLWINGDFQLVNSNVLNLIQSQPISTTSLTLSNGALTLTDSNNNWWTQYLSNNNNSLDLVFRSKGGAMVVFNDDFAPELLNFTGKHRCKFYSDDSDDSDDSAKQNQKQKHNQKQKQTNLIGMIVISTGKYCNLKNEYDTKIDEAIPIVKVCKRKYETRIFGVIGGFDRKPMFKIGNLQFINPDMNFPRVIVQSSGEGLIWVCNYNGNLRNGDYITSSPIEGLGMRQAQNMCFNYTIGKITCDVDFSNSRKLKYKNKVVRRALVGCVYNL